MPRRDAYLERFVPKFESPFLAEPVSIPEFSHQLEKCVVLFSGGGARSDTYKTRLREYTKEHSEIPSISSANPKGKKKYPIHSQIAFFLALIEMNEAGKLTPHRKASEAFKNYSQRVQEIIANQSEHGDDLSDIHLLS